MLVYRRVIPFIGVRPPVLHLPGRFKMSLDFCSRKMWSFRQNPFAMSPTGCPLLNVQTARNLHCCHVGTSKNVEGWYQRLPNAGTLTWNHLKSGKISWESSPSIYITPQLPRLFQKRTPFRRNQQKKQLTQSTLQWCKIQLFLGEWIFNLKSSFMPKLSQAFFCSNRRPVVGSPSCSSECTKAVWDVHLWMAKPSGTAETPNQVSCRQIEAKKHVRKEPPLQVLMLFSYSDITSPIENKIACVCDWLFPGERSYNESLEASSVCVYLFAPRMI